MSKQWINSLTVATLLWAVLPAQNANSGADMRFQRRDRVKRIAAQLYIRGRDDEKRVTKDYVEFQFSQIREIVREEMLDTLGQSDKPGNAREALLAVVGGLNGRSEDAVPPFAYAADLQGLKVVIIGYDLGYGGGLTRTKVVIEGYRRASG